LLLSQATTPSDADRERLLTYSTISLFNLWTEFSRSYCVSVAVRPKRMSGARVSCGLSTRSRAEVVKTMLQATTRGRKVLAGNPAGPWLRKEEPAWEDFNVVIQCLTRCGASNVPDAQRAFSLPSMTVFLGLRSWRNFFAHRNPSTLDVVLQTAPTIGLPATERPAKLLMQRRPGSTSSIAIEWLGELEMVAEELCK
jgi:hypothetical protein